MNFSKTTFFRTQSGHEMVTSAIDQLHEALTAVTGKAAQISQDPKLTAIGKAAKKAEIATEARKVIETLKGDLNRRAGSVVDIRGRFKKPVLDSETTRNYLADQEVRKYILEAYPHQEHRESVLPELMAKNPTILRAVGSCPLPEIRRQFISDEGFNTAVETWVRSNNDPEQVAYADQVEAINEECGLNIRIASEALDRLCGAANSAGSLTRRELAGLAPDAQHEFFRTGGTITD